MQVDEVNALVKSVSWNRVNAGKKAEGPVQCYIGVEFTVDGPTTLSSIAIEDPPKGWGQILWDKDGKPRELCIEKLVIGREFTGLETTFRNEQDDLFGDDNVVAGLYANLRKITVKPVPGRCVDVELQLQLEPPVEVWDHLVALMKRPVVLSLIRTSEEAKGEESEDALGELYFEEAVPGVPEGEEATG